MNEFIIDTSIEYFVVYLSYIIVEYADQSLLTSKKCATIHYNMNSDLVLQKHFDRFLGLAMIYAMEIIKHKEVGWEK